MEDKEILTATRESLEDGSTSLAKTHLDRYDGLREQLHAGDVTQNAGFQKTYNGLFRLRFMPRVHRGTYYAIMEREKIAQNLSFPRLLSEFHGYCHTLEVSFISKLLAIIDPNRPIWDSLVTGHLGIVAQLPRTKESAIAEFETLTTRMQRLLDHGDFALVREAYHEKFPGRDHRPMRILDASLWGLPRR